MFNFRKGLDQPSCIHSTKIQASPSSMKGRTEFHLFVPSLETRPCVRRPRSLPDGIKKTNGPACFSLLFFFFSLSFSPPLAQGDEMEGQMATEGKEKEK